MYSFHAIMLSLTLPVLDRILELGFGKEIEEILDQLGSRPNQFAGKESAVSCNCEP